MNRLVHCYYPHSNLFDSISVAATFKVLLRLKVRVPRMYRLPIFSAFQQITREKTSFKNCLTYWCATYYTPNETAALLVLTILELF